jgi:hypothetical protein
MLAVSHNKSDSEATSMDDPTSLLFGLDEFTVVDVVRVADELVQVVVETANAESACPDCGMRSGRVKDRPRVRIKALPGVRAAGAAVVAQASPAVPGPDVCAVVRACQDPTYRLGRAASINSGVNRCTHR